MELLTPPSLDPSQLASVRALVARLAESGRDPLSDQALTLLASASVAHVLAVDGADVVGYAQLDGHSLEIAALPAAQDALVAHFADRSVLVWTHGATDPLASVLAERRFGRVRELYQLRRRELIDPEVDALPEGVAIRPFVVGTDEDAWLAVNSAAFASHPEQGGWTRADLAAREDEPWFDPAGFLLAWRGASLLGFHWTKVHPDGAGEVYVIGVSPDAQGLGLGAVLLAVGLAHLRAVGCAEVLLYVDGSNTGAMRLYERTGFRPYAVDAQWESPAR